jgi:hypothetical protein
VGLGIGALASLLSSENAGFAASPDESIGGITGLPHFAPKAKRVIFLQQFGGPSQLDLFDYKPALSKFHGTELPDSVRMGQRITGMTSGQKTLPVAASSFKFAQHGQSGAWISEILPHTAKVVDDLAVIKTVYTEAINHDPAITYMQTGSQQPGRPSMGSCELSRQVNQNLPAVVLISQANSLTADQRCIRGSGRLPVVALPGRASE